MTDRPGSGTSRRAADSRIEERLGAILRAGVVASTCLLVVGLLLALFAGETPAAGALLTAGLVLLLATPVARVAMSVIEYVRLRDWTFAVLTAIVLIELFGGVVAALVFHRRL